MALFRLSARSRTVDRLTKLAKRITERCRSEVAQRVLGIEPDMSPCEARGYIRARAAVVVHREVDVTLERERRLGRADRARLISLVTDALVADVTSENRIRSRRAA